MSVGVRRTAAIAEINVTPMAHVMIVLLIIFMVATPLIVQAPVRLPGAVPGLDHPDDHLQIVVHSTGEMVAGSERPRPRPGGRPRGSRRGRRQGSRCV